VRGKCAFQYELLMVDLDFKCNIYERDMIVIMIFSTQLAFKPDEYLKSIKSYNLVDPEEIAKAAAVQDKAK